MSKISDKELFELLKNEITDRFFESNSASSKDISDWKGQDIVNFQEDLFDKVKSTISEKWFYTYFKSEFEKLPRIDMLNILAEYANYSNWHEFTDKHESSLAQEVVVEEEVVETAPPIKEEPQVVQVIEKPIKTSTEKKAKEIVNKKYKLLPVVLITTVLMGFIAVAVYYLNFHQKTYEFCFVDSDRNTTIKEPIEITIARKGFTPLRHVTEVGCIEFPSKEDTLIMTINSTYYKQDTFKINLHSYQGRETIRLIPDDYKVMLRHYSKSSQSVKERIKMLDEMIANDALIYQVYDNEFFGVEVLSKKQYINLVSLPTTSLKNYTLIEAERKDGKIVKIKFKIQSDES